MFYGYLELGGVELVNHERFNAYLTKQMPSALSWFKDPDDNGDLRLGLGDDVYTSPLVDGAPWVDPSNPASQRFYGCYWISEGGFGDSTRTANVTESMGDGATIGPVRLASGQFPISLLLVGADEEAIEAGRVWLNNVLSSTNCAVCNGETLTYLLDVPQEGYVFDLEHGFGDGQDTGLITPARSPYVTNIVGDFTDALCAFVNWDPVITRDTQVEMWIVNDGEEAGRISPVWLRRTNWSPNPNFSVDTSSWSVDDATGSLSRELQVDGSHAMRFTPTDPTQPWSLTQEFHGAYLPRTLSIDMRADTSGVVSVLASGMADPINIGLTNVWQRFTIPLAAGIDPQDFQVAITADTPGAPTAITYVEMRQELIEEGTQSRPFFDASGVAPKGYSLIWLGTPGIAPSRLMYTDPLTLQTVVKPERSLRAYLSVLSGQVDSGLIGYSGTTAPATQWMDRITRQVLRTKATSGPTKSQVIKTNDCGSARIYNLVLTTGAPWAFTLADPSEGVFDNFTIVDDDGVVEMVNLAPNPKAAVDTAFMTADFGDGFGELSAVSLGGPLAAAPSFARMTFDDAPSGAGSQGVDLTGLANWTPRSFAVEDVPLAASVWVRSSIALSAASGVQLTLQPRDLNGDPYSSPIVATLGTVAANTWTELSLQGVIPAAYAQYIYGLTLHLSAPQSGLVNGSTFDFSAIMLNPDSDTVPVYLDGSITPAEGYKAAWRGLADESASVLVRLAPCPASTPTPIVDPYCTPIPTPPRPPVVNLLCAPEDGITSWDRYYEDIPADQVSSTAVTVPVITARFQFGEEQRVMRVRMFPNPFGYSVQDIDPCSFCAEFIVSYMPPNSVLTIDGRTRSASINVDGSGDQNASPMLFGTDGAPMSWPELSCGIPYLMTIDLPAGSRPSSLIVGMAMARRE